MQIKQPENWNSRNFPALHRNLLSCSLLLLLSFTACKKGSEDTGEEDLPVLGTCQSVTPVGHLTQTAGIYTYKTSGGGRIVIDPVNNIMITHDDYPGFKIEFWGDTTVNGQKRTAANHENLNGKHIKDRIGARRTFVFPDGAKLTLVATSAKGPLLSVSIYEGSESHYINTGCNKLESSSANLLIAQQLDKAEADGEAGGIEISPTGLIYFNQYTEDTPGSKATNRYLLGEIFRDKANQVNDYFDDPGLAAT